MVSYVLSIKERLSKLQELARANLASAQKMQKTWYDRTACRPGTGAAPNVDEQTVSRVIETVSHGTQNGACGLRDRHEEPKTQ